MTVRNLDDLLPPIDWREPKAKDATAGETAPTKDKLADAGGAVEGDIEAEIAKIVGETVKPSKP
jgi:hypothetical protein